MEDIVFLYEDDIEDLSEEEIKEKIHNLYPTLVYQLDLDGNFINLFRNTSEASKTLETSQGNIISCCLGERQTAAGYQWVYQREIKDRINKPVKEIELGVRIVQYGMNGKKIKEWKNISEVKKELGISDSHISSCCKGKRKTAGSFQWRYASDGIEELPQIYVKRPVICCETGQEFETCNHAANFFGYSMATVKNSCMGKKTTKPYHFEWKDC